MNKNDKPTLRDVARLAGVSLGSASRAVDAPAKVKPSTRAKVEAAVRALNYVRNGAARALALRRTFIIGAIFPTLNNPIYAGSTQAIQQRLNLGGYQLFIASHEYDPLSELETVRNFIERGVEGVLLVGTDHDPAVFEALKISRMPYVLIWSVDEAKDHCCVGFSNLLGGELIADHLIGLGHKRLAVLTGVRHGNERARYRVEGIRRRLAIHGLELPESHIFETQFTIDGGRKAMIELLKLADRPTAVVCTTDVLAVGACDEARQHRIRVPKDLSITGFDGIGFGALSKPSLTTVSVPIHDIGREGAEVLIAQIEGRPFPQLTELPIDLVVRKSSAAVRNGG